MAEALTVPMLLLQDDGLLLRANAAGLRELESAALLALLDGHVLPARADLRSNFVELLVQVCTTRKRRIWRSPGRAKRFTVAPVISAADQPCQLLMLVMQAEAWGDDPFGLTPTELAVLRGLSQGLQPHEIATARGVTTATVRRHLARIVRRSGGPGE